MERILGLDTGTNSLGWAIVERNDDSSTYKLLDKGVVVFQEGVKIEKGIESSKASERTGYRSIRVGYYRRRVRKIRLLQILVQEHLCPPLTRQLLLDWRLKKVYPNDELFMQWQKTDDKTGDNPYRYRHICLHEKLDLSDMAQRYVLGRALYHMNQRRGFLSNRKCQDETESNEADTEAGKVKNGISNLTKDMHASGCEYLGDYFYKLYTEGREIRNHYTSRKEHLLKEFHAICKMQNLPTSLVERLEKAMFAQRPLKSQKHLVGHCVFEPNKSRCALSHPLYEEFRMLQFVNSIKVTIAGEVVARRLTREERDKAFAKFYRKSNKATFRFEDIAKAIAGRSSYGFVKDGKGEVLFNYPMDTPVSSSPVTAGLMSVFGSNWVEAICEVYTQAEGKASAQIINDIWWALAFFEDTDHLAKYAETKLQLSEAEAKEFANIKIPQGYASLSLCAINKILPYLREGMLYSHAVYFANLCKVIPSYEWNNPQMREGVVENLRNLMDSYAENKKDYACSLDSCIKKFLRERYNLEEADLKKLYHPSMIETYPKGRQHEDGIYQLGSPKIDALRNPMVIRSLNILRNLVNKLLLTRKIDENTLVHIELARELNDANKRKAIAQMNRQNEQRRKKIVDSIKDLLGKNFEPSDKDILKYELWEEQGHLCPYTGQEIGVHDFLDKDNPRFDIEHTIPQSLGGDSSKANLTLCDSYFNRSIKGSKIPSELLNHDEILSRIRSWKDKIAKLDAEIRKNIVATKGTSTKDVKDSRIVKRRVLEMERNYWQDKYHRFEMDTVSQGFSLRQGSGNETISKYARMFLKSVFRKVYTVKGLATSDFRKMWGIQSESVSKERVNHVHHCIDAIVIACMDKEQYAQLARYYHHAEKGEKVKFPLPWSTFVADIKRIQKEVFVVHDTTDNMPKKSKRRIHQNGKHKGSGKVVYAQGDAARGSLHLQTCYGAIQTAEGIKYVVRKPLASLEKAKDRESIVDATVKSRIEDAIRKWGDFKTALEHGIWMNEEKQIPIKNVRCFAPSVKNPLHIRMHRDKSAKEYKQQYHVANDRNYMMALYEGINSKGKPRRGFEIVNNLRAAKFYKESNKNGNVKLMVPSMKDRLPLTCVLKIGSMVLLYENSPAEVWNSPRCEMVKRLYKVTGLSPADKGGFPYGVITLTFHQEARPSGELKSGAGAYKVNEVLRPRIMLYHTQFKALVQGYDFEIDETGEIKRI